MGVLRVVRSEIDKSHCGGKLVMRRLLHANFKFFKVTVTEAWPFLALANQWPLQLPVGNTMLV